MNPPARPRLVFLFSDTGGGHRSAAEAIIGALEHGYPGQFTPEMVDIFHDYAPALLNRVPDIYPPLSHRPKLLGQIYRLSDDPRRIRRILNLVYPFIRTSLNRLIAEHPGDVFISVHPLINYPLGRALEKTGLKTPWVTVVTDLVTVHTTWFCPRSDLIVLPTQEAWQIGMHWGIASNRLKVIGLPVAEEFGQRNEDAREIKTRLGWPLDDPVILLMGGGEGIVQLETMADAIDEACLPVTLVIVAGRNTPLKQRLEDRPWKTPTRIYGFVQAMPDFMHAATILLTKAGPGTISEAMTSGLPVILYSRLDGPEDGNVSYVVDHGAGIWAPDPGLVVEAVTRWLAHPEERARAASACRTLAHPQAAREIADLIMTQINDNV